MKNIILMGLPGAGKGTQADKIVETFHLAHISTGDMFREAIANETPIGKEVKKIIDAGDLVPDELTAKLVKERLAQPDTADGYILDGFPRTTIQAELLESITRELNKPLQKVINIQVDPEILIDRLSGRYISKDSGATYHKLYNPVKIAGTDDKSGGHAFYQRKDDVPDVVKNRLDVNIKMNTPLIDFYQSNGLLTTVDGQRDTKEVFSDISDILNALN